MGISVHQPIPIQPAILRSFRRRLTNLSSRNRSLLLTNLPAGQFLDLHETDFLLNKPSFAVIADLIGRKASVALCDVLDARQQRSNEVSRKLRRIARTARFITEERGTEDLYVGWPFIRGKFLDDTIVHGPLLFFPVQLSQQGKHWKLTHRGDELAFLNPTLALAYGQFNQVKLADDVVEKTMDDFDRDPLVFRTQLYEWLKASLLELNFNQDLFTDKLQFFDRQTSKTLTQLERTGELKLFPEAVLGIFPQAGSYLVPDYDALIAAAEQAIAETGFVTVPPTLPVLPDGPGFYTDLPERFLRTPLPLDASQEAAVRAVKAGQSLVVQGPPGTGKSQLIANLMADAAADGKRVLLVCQKRAALDVVQERLCQVGMAPFMALIHDFQDDRRGLYAQIAGQIEQIDAYRQQNNSLDAVLLERDFDVESRRIDESVADLQAFKDALFDTSDCGISAKELYLTSQPGGQTIDLDDCYQQFRIDTASDFTRRLSDYVAYQQRLGPTHPWVDRVSFARFTFADQQKADSTIEQWLQLALATTSQTHALVGQPLSLAALASWQIHDWSITALLALMDKPDVPSAWPLILYLRNTPSHPALTVDETQFTTWADAWDSALAVPGPESTLLTEELPAFQALLTDALTARSSWVRWTWWQLTNAGKNQLQQVATANSLTLSEVDLQRLAERITKRLQVETLQQQTQSLLIDLPLPVASASLRILRWVRQIVERLQDIPPIAQLFDLAWQSQPTFVNTVSNLLNTAKTVDALRSVSQTYLTDGQLAQIWTNNVYATTLRQSLRRDVDLLIESDRLWDNFSEPERTVTDRLKAVDTGVWVTVFANSLRLAWLSHLEQQYPQLRSVSSLKMAQTEQALQESVRRKQQLSRDILLVKLREQTYQRLTINRLNNVTTYRDLLHQVSKKRNIWPVRKLMESFADEVFKVVPCWLASPESVSAIFPLRNDLFDLVIFDEASQCFAENGVPAMFRGKQVVVTGDNQQLRPSDLYRVQLDDRDMEDDDIPAALEVESLLELAAQQLPQVSLTEHYRSRSLDLITFSNEHFYGRKLRLLPYFDDINRHEPAIRYLNVKGTWQQNTNQVEADAVLRLLDELAVDLPGRSVGVVTFNYPQQQLIQEMVEANQSDGVIPHLFVKNIENVQGDERDVIIFSIGYAPRVDSPRVDSSGVDSSGVDSPDERGRLAMQFGSLNARGGENRLNVAVTRARERVYVVTSLWPDQLNVTNVTNTGPVLLKAYLTYALNVAQSGFRAAPDPKKPLGLATLLAEKLAQQNPNWQPELPFADLTIKSGDHYDGLILTDDGRYYEQSPKEAHAYLPAALQLREWPFNRAWSRTYWQANEPE